MRSFITCKLHQILLGRSNQGEIGGACSTHGRDYNAYKILVGKPGRKNHSEDLIADGRIIL
jgi:hypothetical protein